MENNVNIDIENVEGLLKEWQDLKSIKDWKEFKPVNNEAGEMKGEIEITVEKARDTVEKEYPLISELFRKIEELYKRSPE